MPVVSRRGFLTLSLCPFAAMGCRNGIPTIFGYQLGNEALYDTNIKTVYVPTFYNRAFQTTPYRGFEVDLTQALIREIGKVTPYRVTSDVNKADTELIGVIMLIQKNIMNRTQQNTVRDGELVVSVDLIWRDLRDGTILSAPTRNPVPTGITTLPLQDPEPIPFDPYLTPIPAIPVPPSLVPTRIVAWGRYLPELGETNASAMNRVQKNFATQVVSMMEKKWR
ncbi:MAG TPA: LPS assembly lipoprotein LptE [Gemmata sp.]|nr:LPS assembly lipoprotein LptE [Gemmata sp.]